MLRWESGKVNPVTKVVNLLGEMQKQAEAEAREDDALYNKMKCWCETNNHEKTQAITIAEGRIDDYSAAIEQGEAHAAELSGQIDSLKSEMQEQQDSIVKASGLRGQEKASFEKDEQDSMEALASLKEAIVVLEKVQLLQGHSEHKAAAVALIQARSLASKLTRAATLLEGAGVGAHYTSVMQKDLWDFFGALPSEHTRVITGLDQEPTGYAAGATSYEARSSQIFGMLKTMQATFSKNLAQAHKEEIDALIAYQRLKATKDGEIQAAIKSVDEKTLQLGDTKEKVALAKEGLEDTREALSADERFLVDLKKRCATADKDYETRRSTRLDELAAISDAIRIISTDAARDVFSRTVSLLQTGVNRRVRVAGKNFEVLTDRQLRAHAASKLLDVAKNQRGTFASFHLATLAVGVRLDGFEQVRKLMDNMVARLTKQQQDEYTKHEACTKDIHANEREARSKTSDKKDLEGETADIERTLATLDEELEELKAQIGEMHTSLQQAGEERLAQNHEFQQEVVDQRATAAVLSQGLERLREFYTSKPKTLLAVRAQHSRQEPGTLAPSPPVAGKEHTKSRMAPGVIQMLEKIIQEAQRAEQEAAQSEQASQEAYSEFVANTNAVLDASEKAVAAKGASRNKAEADKLNAGINLKATTKALADLADLNQALHVDCDYLLQNYSVRQKARQEEVEAIKEAKAILQGANFGA